MTNDKNHSGLPPDEKAVPSIGLLQLCELFDNCSDRTVQNYAEEGRVIRDERGQYDRDGTIRALYRWAKELEANTSRERVEQEIRKLKLHNDRAQIRLLQEAGALVNAELAKRMVEKVFSAIRQRMMMMPKFLAPRVEGLAANEIEGVLDEYARDSLAALAEPEIGGRTDTGSLPDHGPAAASQHERVGGRKKKAQRKDSR